jgi:cytochrome P450
MDTGSSSDESTAEDAPALRYGRAPGAWPGLGHVPALLHQPLRLLGSLPAHGDLVEIRLGPRPVLVLCHPDLARQVLADFRTFDRVGPVYRRVRGALGNGLATASRDDHRRQRLIMQPAFRREYMAGYAAVMHREITATTGSWHDGQLVDLVDEMFRLTTGVALRALFSARIDAGDAQGLRSALDVFLKGIYTRVILPVTAGLPVPGNLRFARALAYWRGQVRRLIEESRALGAGGDDLMSRLIKARDDENQGMSDQELSDQVALLLLAGGETTSSAVVWALHLLNGHPQVLRALHAEVDAVLDGRVATWEDMPRLGLTARVVHEALRLYPPAWAIPRVCVRDTTLAGRTVRGGTMVIFSPYILHRRADQFPRPQNFDPDRWLTAEPSAAAPRRAAFLPFGAGAAKCIGEDFGLAEAVLILSSVAARWDLTPKPGTSVSARPRSVLAPGKFPVYLTRRERRGTIPAPYSGSA